MNKELAKKRESANTTSAKPAKAAGANGQSQKKAPKRRKKGQSWKKRIAYWLVTLLLWSVIAMTLVVVYIAMGLPDTSKLPLQSRSPGISLVAKDGKVLARRGNISGETVDAGALPSHVREAVLSIEDKRFFDHHGIDVRGVLRASWINLIAGELRQGGSTITQQLAKNLFLTPERSLTRKIREALLAVWLEIRFSKEEILSLYLNRVYFGAGAYGIDAASQQYFQKSVFDLSLREAALLAGLLKAPSRYAPSHDSTAALERAAMVLQAMAKEGYINAETAQDAGKGVRISMLAGSSDVNYAADWLAARIPDYLGGLDKDILAQTTLDTTLQSHAEDVVEEYFSRPELRDQDIQVALVAMDSTGAVRAMVGGRSYSESRFNRAAQARRQPGSAFKPAVYLAALEQGLSPMSRRNDKPLEIEGWRPRNYGNHYRGEISLREAFAHSSNSVAVLLSEEIGRERVISTARRLGITGQMRAHPSLPLGVFEISPLELTAAYVPFANGGFGVSPHGIVSLRDNSGNLLYRRLDSGGERIIDSEALRGMKLLMREVLVTGTGMKANLGTRPAAGKTGTTQDSRDAWFIGFTDHLIATVWVGRDSGAPMEGISGGNLPAEIWRAFMLRAHEGLSVRPIPERK